MALTTPTVQQISDNIVSNIENSISQTVPLLPKAFTRVLAKVLAGVFVIAYKYAGFSLLQQFPAFATINETVVNGTVLQPLVEWGRLIGIGDPTASTRAEMTSTVTVLNQTGQLDAGTQLIRSDTGVIYLTLTAVLLDAPTKVITVRASSDQEGNGGAGTIGNLNPGDIISFANPLPNVATDTVIVAQTVTGADGETEDAYRERVIDRMQSQPQGGAYADYRLWGSEVEGILNVYPYTGQMPGEVDIYSEATVASSGSDDGIPTAAQLTAVFDAIELDENGLASRRPANASVNSLPIVRIAFDVIVSGLVAPDPADAQAAIESAVDDFLRAREPFIVGLSILPRVDRVTQAGVAGIVDEAAAAVGGSITTVMVEQNNLPINAFTLDDGEKAKLENITFV